MRVPYNIMCNEVMHNVTCVIMLQEIRWLELTAVYSVRRQSVASRTFS